MKLLNRFVPLPSTLGLDLIRERTPHIGKPSIDVDRPFWSVMIPTYNNGEYLRRTLESVLRQDPGPERMQIEIVDGCSTEDNPADLWNEFGDQRLSFHRLTENRGPAHTFNVCIERSRGRWIHILHGDDMVLPGFYEAYGAVIEAHPNTQAVVGQSLLVDEHDRWVGLYGPKPPIGGGVIDGFDAKQTDRQQVLFPGVVVRRDAYEEVGGFCTLFSHVTDWDMWFRIGQLGPVAAVPHPHALYRVHGESDTHHQMVSGTNMRERYLVTASNVERRTGCSATSRRESWHSQLAAYADDTAWELDSRGSFEGRFNQARWAWFLEPTPRRAMMLIKSWLKLRARSRGFF